MQPHHDPFDIAVDDGRVASEGDRRDGRGGVGPDPRQRPQPLFRLRETAAMVLRDPDGGRVQVARPRVVAEPRPGAHDLFGRRRREVGAPSTRTSSYPFSPASVLHRSLPGSPTEPNIFSFPSRPLPNPEEHCNPLSYITYSWLSPLIAVGATRPLSDNDLFEVRTDYAARVAAKRFSAEWAKEVSRAAAAGDRSKASMVRPFLAIYGRNYFLAFLAKFVATR